MEQEAWRLAKFMGEQEEREAVVDWLRANNRCDIADAIEMEKHRRDTQENAPPLSDV